MTIPHPTAASSFIPHPSSLDAAAPAGKWSWPTSPVPQLKLLWRGEMSEAERDYWHKLFASPIPNCEIRREIKSRHGIALLYNIL